jgi:TRAP-type C4-dicarboxylate transport system substrate-binding protein
MAQICTGYHPGKNPGLTVLDLPGLPLVDPDVHARVHDAVYKHPAIVAEFKRWNAMLLMSVLQPQSELMGTGETPSKMENFKGMRVRALGGTGDALRNLGAVPTSVPAPEVYNALERGVFQAVAFPYTYAFASYKIPEISKWYTTNLGPGANTCPTIVNLPAYEALPPNYKQLIENSKPKAYEALKQAQKAADEKNLADWNKRGLTAIKYTDAELKKFVDLGAGPVWSAWVKASAEKGVPAQQLLDFVLAEAAKAKQASAK